MYGARTGLASLSPAFHSYRSSNSVNRVSSSSSRLIVSSSTKYDYVICGGGTAGCLLANRLSEDDNNRVLLLEAGTGKQGTNIRVPAGLTRLFRSEFDWNLFSTKQDAADGRSLYVARGKVIGGSSSTNATLYLRGSSQDYSNWDIAGWSPDNVLKWFLHAEDHSEKQSPYHRRGGLMHVEPPRYKNDLHGVMLGAAREFGMDSNPDFNDWSRSQEGSGDFDVTQRRGVRADAYVQFLKPVLKRENLDVITKAQVSKILFEKGTDKPRAIGVEFSADKDDSVKKEIQLEDSGEVILCSGAIHSPHLLLLSGIGPSNQLNEFGIEVISNLPGVGQNLQDHPAVLSAFKLKPEYSHLPATNIFKKNGKIKKRVLLQYALFKTGPLTTTLCDRGAFLKTGNADQPNLQFRFNAGYALDPDGVSSFVKFGEMLDKGGSWPAGITLQVIACRPHSRGSLTLASNDPRKPPKINIGYLTDSAGLDIQTLREGLRVNRKMAETSVMSEYVQEEGFPGKALHSDKELDGYIRKTVHSANAVVGSCRMGVTLEDGSVVSPELKVHGVDGLRVVDASIIPKLPGGQTAAPTVMIAEKGAHMIKHKLSATEC